MTKVFLVARYLLVLMLIVFGLNKFLGFLPDPGYLPLSKAFIYMGALGSVHMFQALGIIYLASAAALLANKFVGLVCVTLAAIDINILLFHLNLDTANIAPAIVLTVLLAINMLANSSKLTGLLR